MFLFFVFTNFVWLITDQKLPTWDPAADFISTMQYCELLKDPSIKIFREAAEISAQNAYRPPLVRFLICPFYSFFPKNIFFTTLLMSIIFWYVLLFAVFNLGKLIKNEKVGLCACFIIGTCPFVFTLSRIYLLDFPLIAMVALSLYLLLLAFQTGRIRHFVILGIVLALSSLTKGGFVVFLIGPLLYLLVLRNKRSGIIFSLLLASIIALLYYGFIFKGLLSFTQWNMRHGLLNEGDPPWNTIEGWLYYLRTIVAGTSFFYLLFFIVGLFSIFKMRKEYCLTLLLWISLPYLLLSFAGNKDGRYIVPALPAIALISAFGIDTFFKKRFKKIIIVSMMILGTAQFVSISFGIIRLPKIKLPEIKICADTYLHIPLFTPRGYFGYWFDHNPKREDWKIKELFTVIENDWKEQKVELPLYILLLTNQHVYNGCTMTYCNFIFGKNFEFNEVSYFNPSLIKNKNYPYVVYKNYNNSCCWWDRKSISEAYSYIEENPSEFKCIYQDKLPDGSTLYCYKRIL